MQINTQNLKRTFQKMNYRWYTDRPNLIGIRSALDAPNLFNDIFCLVWTQDKMPDGLSNDKKQSWLNSNLFMDPIGNKLKVDGNFGPNSNYAFSQYQSLVGKERIEMWTITTDPGTYWLKNPLNNLGTALLKPNQWVDCWSLGNHQGNSSHPALVQTSKITVYRDNDKDNLSEEGGREETGLFGINIHRSNANGKTPTIDKWSAGCQVFQQKYDHDKLLTLCNYYKSKVNNKFTFTLLREKELY